MAANVWHNKVAVHALDYCYLLFGFPGHNKLVLSCMMPCSLLKPRPVLCMRHAVCLDLTESFPPRLVKFMRNSGSLFSTQAMIYCSSAEAEPQRVETNVKVEVAVSGCPQYSMLKQQHQQQHNINFVGAVTATGTAVILPALCISFDATQANTLWSSTYQCFGCVNQEPLRMQAMGASPIQQLSKTTSVNPHKTLSKQHLKVSRA